MNRIIKFVIFCDWLLLLSVLFLRFIHIAACISTSFLFYCQIIFQYKYTTFYLSINICQLMCKETAGCLQFWGIMLLRIFVYRILCECVFSFFLDIYLTVKLLGHMATLNLILEGIFRLFSNVAAPSMTSYLKSVSVCQRVNQTSISFILIFP